MRIRLQAVDFSYAKGAFRLDVPELEISSGSSVAVIGPSGSGKTTLLHLIAGILSPDAGQILVGDTDVTSLDERARRAFRIRTVGAVFQEFELLEYLTVRENIVLPYRITRELELTADTHRRAAALAEDVGLADKLGRPPGRLSHGEKQRVALCRALIVRPGLLLADEPTGNLDPANKDLVLDLLVDQARRTGATLITVTHDHAVLDRFDRVIDADSLRDASSEVVS